MEKLNKEISDCIICADHLEPNPVLQVSVKSKISIIGQAPGSVVHRTGIPWDDQSGNNLRKWMGVNSETFYDADQIALIPMGFCYPGKGKSGDLPPRPECAPQWHEKLFAKMAQPKLTILIGQYAQKYYLGNRTEKTLTATVQRFESYLPKYFVLPHPSPRNNIWQAKNPWFSNEVLPRLKVLVQEIL
ncbi:MAG: uracil-DNA glycosylase family protein [Cyclobacteriaceae bacterium]